VPKARVQNKFLNKGFSEGRKERGFWGCFVKILILRGQRGAF